MTEAATYANALYELLEKNPDKAKEYSRNLEAALARRGHQKLLPRILAELERVGLTRDRKQKQKASTPETEQTRQLLELYRTLLASN